MDYTTALAIATIIFFIIYWLNGNKHKKFPPGPWGVPLIGYIPFMSSKPYIDFQNLAKKYGPIYSVKLGSQNVIVLSDYEHTKEAFAQDAFMGRPPEQPFEVTKETFETKAFIGLPWKEQRRASLHILRDLGLGKTSYVAHIKEELHDLLEYFENLKGKPIDLKPILSSSMSNNIATLVFGKRMKYDDPIRKMLDNAINDSAAAAGQVTWEIFFPGLAKVAKFLGLSGAKKLSQIVQKSRDYTVRQIEDHEKTLDENNIRDYIDGYLIEIKKRNDAAFCKKVLEDMVLTFFGAGSETVRITVGWLMLTMAGYQDIQAKVFAEIESVIGLNRSPNLEDRTEMPYTEATIMELMRWRTIVPLNIMRYTLWDSELNGYVIPKNHFILANIWDIHHKPKYWGKDAEEFRPERFLSEDLKEVKKSEYLIPFSIGKRACPGETYARMEVFMYFVTILQKFKVTLPPGKMPCFDGDLGIGLAPKPQELCLIKRL